MAEIMGILNITPDSFSDGGKYVTLDAAVAQAQALIKSGATIIDVGGESTRPGSVRVTPEQEQERILPVIKALADQQIVISVDTVNATTADAALAAGAQIINDVSGGLHDPDMFAVVAKHQAGFIIGHWRGFPDAAHSRSEYGDVTAEVTAHLHELTKLALAAGISRDKIILDPGLGFDKTAEQCWQLIRELDQLLALDFPVLIGVSRKRMIAQLLTDMGAESDIENRDFASAVASAWSVVQGAWGVRVHNVAATVQALAVLQAGGADFSDTFPDPSAGIAKMRLSNSAQCAEPRLGAQSVKHEGGTACPSPVQHTEMDEIKLTGIEVFAHHGVFDFEKQAGQPFIVDAVIGLAAPANLAHDDLSRTVDYAAVADALHHAAANEPVDLLETLAERLAQAVLNFSGVARVRITVHKPQAPLAVPFSDVALTITRSVREDVL